MAVLVFACAACGPEDPAPFEEEGVEHAALGGLSVNGLSSNGFSSNGLSANGLSANGLSANGLSANGLSSTAFTNWCGAHLSDGLCNNIMSYMVKCACDTGITRAAFGYTWYGNLGVADAYCAGSAPTVTEQRAMTACLMAHVNTRIALNTPASTLNQSLAISLRMNTGVAATSVTRSQEELQHMGTREGVFFGNLWDPYYDTKVGMYRRYNIPLLVGSSGQVMDVFDAFWGSTGRGCTNGNSCNFQSASVASCVPASDGSGAYDTCTVDGITYPAMTVFLGALSQNENWTNSQGASLSTWGGSPSGSGYDAVDLPYDIDRKPASSQLTTAETFTSGRTYQVGIGFWHNITSQGGHDQYCLLEIDRNNDGVWDVSSSVLFPASNFAIDFLRSAGTFVGAGTRVRVRWRTDPSHGLLDDCPILDFSLIAAL